MSNDIQPTWNGHFELKNAKWELDTGRTAEFRIVYYQTQEPVEHPFRHYQRQRGGKVGQRFHLCLVPDGLETVIYDSEVMLAGWSDNEGGRTVKFWLDEDAERHPLAGYSKRTTKEPGSMFSAALVVINDDNTVMEKEEPETKRKFSQDAHLIVTSALFIQYLTEKCGHTQVLEKKGQSWTPQIAKQWVKNKLGIESLSDLDRDRQKLDLFHQLIREPYVKWQGRE